MAGNPITTISPQGTMGFKLGDKWNFVLSRMLHLQLITKEEFKKYKEEYPAYIGDWMECSFGRFVVSCHFNNIKQIEFSMKNGMLTNIYIELSAEQAEMDFLKRKIKHMVSKKYGQPLENTADCHFFMWPDRKTMNYIMLSMDNDTITIGHNDFV